MECSVQIVGAIGACGFRPHYQPIVKSGGTKDSFTIVGYESLCRQMLHDKLIAGDQIVSEARASNMLYAIDSFMTMTNIVVSKRVNVGEFISVNVSARSLVNPLFVSSILDQDISGRLLVLEITESERLKRDEFAGLAANVDSLREAGWKIAIDDFGDGHSSLRYLNRIGVDIVKISRDTLLDLKDTGRPNRLAFMKDLVSSVHNQGITTVLEGIETDMDLNIADRLGVEMMQGYLFGKPSEYNKPGMLASKLMPYVKSVL